ncbi:unnamed protein product [Polarella glacialis]|uniref:Fe2OG dioxygenase domain-containing protein n=1 Tax=Polarella glacialis TaxID=89957 RepID=A0A813GD82_POLGL|nr:unnamed protein product [Polarella glacialis]
MVAVRHSTKLGPWLAVASFCAVVFPRDSFLAPRRAEADRGPSNNNNGNNGSPPKAVKPRASSRRPARAKDLPLTKEGCLEEVLAKLVTSHVPVMPAPEVKARMQLLHADPAVFLIPDFWPKEACQRLINAANSSGEIRQSSITGQGIYAGEERQIRTSGSVVMKPEMARRYNAEDLVRRLIRDLVGTLGVGCAGAGQVSKLLTSEYPQVVRYERGQYFTDHEDAFAASKARVDNYQRRVTLLVYLNDVEKGGATRFPKLGFQVKPRQGQALLFFPSFANGRPDPRTLHSAEAAEDEKWIAQVWIGSPMPSHRR